MDCRQKGLCEISIPKLFVLCYTLLFGVRFLLVLCFAFHQLVSVSTEVYHWSNQVQWQKIGDYSEIFFNQNSSGFVITGSNKHKNFMVAEVALTKQI